MTETPTTPAGRQPPSGFARRSDRISIAVPIQVKGTDSTGKSFDVKTRTLMIGRYGAMILLAYPLGSGQELTIRCIGTALEARGRVVGQLGAAAEGNFYGVEILDSEVNLWEINFPAATESEMAAGRVLLECSRCHASEVVYLNILEIEIFDKNQCVSRPCQPCNDVTIWNHASLHKLLAEPITLPADIVGQPEPAAPQRTENERIDPRINLRLAGCIKTAQYGEDVGVADNVSEAGACFRSQRQYAGGTIVGAAIPYVEGRPNVFVQARITWSQYRAVEGLKVYGLSYVHARRRAKRVKPRTTIRIGFIGSGVRSAGSIVNLSMNGVLVRCPEQLEAGTAVRMGIEMGHETIRMAATAKRCIPGIGTAFEFTQMAHRDRSLLRRLVLRLEKQWPY